MEWLATAPAQRVLASLPAYEQSQALSVSQQLRADGLPADQVQAVLTQSRLRTRARERWGDVVDQLILTTDGSEQATRPVVAAHRATRFVKAGVRHVAELGCGLGLDALGLAAAGLQVTAYEQDPTTAAAAQINARTLGYDSIHVVCADVTGVDFATRLTTATESGPEAAFADPARRSAGKRIASPERWSPPLSWVIALPFSELGVKVAPGLSHDAVPGDMEFEVVSVAGDVVEAGLYRGELRSDCSRRATLLPSGQSLTDHELPMTAPPVGVIGDYLYEPDGAVIRAGLVAAVANQLGGRLIDPAIAYITNDRPDFTPFARCYAVTDVMPFRLKKLRALLRDRKVGRVTIKKRGSAVEPESLRHQLRLDHSMPGEATIVLTRVHGNPLMLLVEPTS